MCPPSACSSDITWMVDKSLLMLLAQHIASITSWCWKSLDTIYVSRCSPTSALSELIGATSLTGQVPGLRSAASSNNPPLTGLILASCSDAPVSMILWCQRRASGLDKPPYGWIPALSVSPRAAWLSVHLHPGWSAGCPVHSHRKVGSAAKMLKHAGMYITCVCLDESFHTSSPDDVRVCVSFIVDDRQ